MVSLKRLTESFYDAWRGLWFVYKHEQNFRIQTIIALIVLVFAFIFPLARWETILLVLLILLVLTIEILNTAFEHFTDLFKPRIHPYVGVIKDVMAGAVLLTSVVALIIGWMILFPHFITYVK